MGQLGISGKTVLVVGGSSGIGRGIATAFRDGGADTHIWGTKAAAADYDDAGDLDGLTYSQVDVADADRVRSVPAGFEKLDVLILCQGTVLYRRQEYEIEAFRRVVEVNLSSMMTCAQRFFPMLREAGGTVITVSSTAAYQATRGNPAYSASKTGILGLTRSLAQAWAGEGVRVNGIAPGLVDTKLTRVTTGNPERLAGALASIPIGRLGQPADMAGAALFLASPLASYIVGHTITIDGGLTL